MKSGIMYGITHELDGSLIIREPRILKVGIGLPKGPALTAWISPDGQWKLTIGYKKGETKTITLPNRHEAEEAFHRNLQAAPVCSYPRKVPYFTFSRPSIDNGNTVFIPDFDAMEAHGSQPTEIDIVLLDDRPFDGAYQMWSSSELRCKGDGVTAMRLVTMATPEDDAEEYRKRGDKYFPYVRGCWTAGCPYSKESGDKPSPCKPGGDLRFQLACNIRIGGTAYFHTTGYRSISSIFSSLHRISTLTGGRLAGIPLKMVLRPFRTNHNGQAATHYAVALEFRAPDPQTLSKRLMESVFNFHPEAATVRMIEPAEAEGIDEGDEVTAQAMADEFYPDKSEPAAPAVQVATEKKTEGLADKMEKVAEQKPTPAATVAPAAATPIVSNDKPEDMF